MIGSFNKNYSLLIAIVFFIACINPVYALCPPDCDSESEIDYSDPQTVNSLTSDDLVNAILDGKISDFSIINDQLLAESFSKNPSIVSLGIGDDDFIRAMAYDSSLIGNPSLFDEYNSRAVNSPSFINQNVELKKGWFGHYGIEDEGALIESYDGVSITTSGEDGTTFPINKFPGATVLPTGKLVLAQGTQISKGIVDIGLDGKTNVLNGATVLSGIEDFGLKIIGGKVSYNGHDYVIDPSSVLSADMSYGSLTLSGNNVNEFISGKLVSSFTGKLAVSSDDLYSFFPGLTYDSKLDDTNHISYTVENPPNGKNILYTRDKQDFCSGITNCISQIGSQVSVNVVDNKLSLKTNSPGIAKLVIDEFSDDKSSVRYSIENGPEYLFSKDKINTKGVMISSRTTIVTTLKGQETTLGVVDIITRGSSRGPIDYKDYLALIKDLESKGYTAADITLAIQQQKWGVEDNNLPVPYTDLKIKFVDLPENENEQGARYKELLNVVAGFPAVVIGPEGEQINMQHAMAYHAATLNDPTFSGLSGLVYTDAGDVAQVLFESKSGVQGYAYALKDTVVGFLSSDEESVNKGVGNFKNAIGFWDESQRKGNTVGQLLSSQIYGTGTSLSEALDGQIQTEAAIHRLSTYVTGGDNYGVFDQIVRTVVGAGAIVSGNMFKNEDSAFVPYDNAIKNNLPQDSQSPLIPQEPKQIEPVPSVPIPIVQPDLVADAYRIESN